MKLSVGDNVINQKGEKGVVQEVFKTVCFVNYGEFAVVERLNELKKEKQMTAKQVWKAQDREKEDLKVAQECVEIMTDLLETIGNGRNK